jgi:hypothetical protein
VLFFDNRISAAAVSIGLEVGQNTQNTPNNPDVFPPELSGLV